MAMELLIGTSNEEKTFINPWDRAVPNLDVSHTCNSGWKIVSKQLPKVFWGCFPRGSQIGGASGIFGQTKGQDDMEIRTDILLVHPAA